MVCFEKLPNGTERQITRLNWEAFKKQIDEKIARWQQHAIETKVEGGLDLSFDDERTDVNQTP